MFKDGFCRERRDYFRWKLPRRISSKGKNAMFVISHTYIIVIVRTNDFPNFFHYVSNFANLCNVLPLQFLRFISLSGLVFSSGILFIIQLNMLSFLLDIYPTYLHFCLNHFYNICYRIHISFYLFIKLFLKLRT